MGCKSHGATKRGHSGLDVLNRSLHAKPDTEVFMHSVPAHPCAAGRGRTWTVSTLSVPVTSVGSTEPLPIRCSRIFSGLFQAVTKLGVASPLRRFL